MLVEQGETIRNINSKADLMEVDLKTSAHVMKGLETSAVFNYFKGLFVKDPEFKVKKQKTDALFKPKQDTKNVKGNGNQPQLEEQKIIAKTENK